MGAHVLVLGVGQPVRLLLSETTFKHAGVDKAENLKNRISLQLWNESTFTQLLCVKYKFKVPYLTDILQFKGFAAEPTKYDNLYKAVIQQYIQGQVKRLVDWQNSLANILIIV